MMLSILILIVILIIFNLFIKYFNRSPIKNFPKKFQSNNIVVSPSYGKVIDIIQSTHNITIKIVLNIFDVHVQYAPISGILIDLIHSPGKHNIILSETAKLGKTYDNENLLYIIKPFPLWGDRNPLKCDSNPILVRQIAGKFARRCVPFVSSGDVIFQQEPIGRILFGSQVDITIPSFYNILCKKGDRLIGGETIIAFPAGGQESSI